MKFAKYILINCILISMIIYSGCSNEAATINSSSEVADEKITEHIQWPDLQWSRSSLDDNGIDANEIEEIEHYISSQDLQIDSMLIVHNGHLVKELYANSYDSNTRHQIYSVTKSIISALVGIALEEGKIKSINQPLSDFFPELLNNNNKDTTKKSITLQHLLTMTSGIYWPELIIPYSSQDNPLIQMYDSPNQVQFILDQDVVQAPGLAYNYSSADSHLLSAILQSVVGMTTEQYAREKLFKPIGITNIEWPSDPQGISLGGAGLYMLPEDMARFGYLYLHNGVWHDQQIIPSSWVEQSTQLHISGMFQYGYLWRIGSQGDYYAMGYRGQFILVSPSLDLVAVFTGDLDTEFLPLTFFEKIKEAVKESHRS